MSSTRNSAYSTSNDTNLATLFHHSRHCFKNKLLPEPRIQVFTNVFSSRRQTVYIEQRAEETNRLAFRQSILFYATYYRCGCYVYVAFSYHSSYVYIYVRSQRNRHVNNIV